MSERFAVRLPHGYAILLTLFAGVGGTAMAAGISSPVAPAAQRKLATDTPGMGPGQAPAATQPPSAPQIYIREYRVEGAHQLNQIEIEEAVYPFLGPGRTADDVEQARAALEKAYRDKGFQTVSVQAPEQQGRGGIVFLQVVESKVGRLRVKGSRYYSLDQIERLAPSVAPGRVPNFNEINRDILALNQLSDRRITPALRAGVEPGTVDIDLTVKDTLPLHGSVELNNRYSADTTSLRLNGSLSYSNLWQRGHAAGVSFQIAPEHTDDAQVISGYYGLRFPAVPWLNLVLQGTKQDSNVSTLGGSAVVGRGEILGLRMAATLPSGNGFYHSLSLGFDYKHFDETVRFGFSQVLTPITYYPFSASYGATWVGKGRVTELNAGINFHIRGLGDDLAGFDSKRFKADGSYFFFRGDLTHTQDLPGGFQIMGKVQGQAAGQPLLNSEQFSGGGLGTVRGYLESAVLGDNAIFGSLELRSPSLLREKRKTGEGASATEESTGFSWQIYAFCEGGMLTLNDPLPEQQDRFDVGSYGVGSRLRLFDHLNGSVDFGMPLISQSQTKAHDPQLTFRVWADF